jgi:hypothetical protein
VGWTRLITIHTLTLTRTRCRWGWRS